MAKRLYRSETDRMLGGVSGGLAEAYDLDPTLIRLAWVLFGLVSGGTAILFYIIAWLIIPTESSLDENEKKTVNVSESSATEDITDYEEIVSGTVDDAKEELESLESPDYEKALEAEKENKNRATLVEWLEKRVE